MSTQPRIDRPRLQARSNRLKHAHYFVEGRLRQHPESEEAFADFSAALQGLDDATLKALRMAICGNNQRND
jgi:hypothetical protein